MTEYNAIRMESFNYNKGYIFKLPNGLEVYVKDNILYLPKIFNIYKNNEYEKNVYQNNNSSSSINNIKPCGLFNIGGVCYMNAVLQCFFYCKPLTEYFLNVYNKNNLGPISKGYFSFIKGLSSGNKEAAKKFKEIMIKSDESFYGTDGNDSKDVAMFILSELHNELKPNKNNEKIKLDDKTINNYDINDVYYVKLKLDEINGNSTIISETFNYLIKVEQKCGKNCQKYNNSFYTIETDNILLLDLDALFPHDNISISVEDILKSYTSFKKIDCPYCKKKSLYIRNKFCSLPKILVLVLSRGYHNRFKCEIKFTETLDMADYYEPVNKNDNVNTEYNLIGATFAYDWSYEGTGHTVAFCKTYQDDNYYIFNDRTCRKSKISEINGKMPYLLFYERNINEE